MPAPPTSTTILAWKPSVTCATHPLGRKLMLSSLASHANPPVQPDAGKGSTMNDGSGPTSRTVWGWFSRSSSSLKTYGGYSPSTGKRRSKKSSQTLPLWGSMRAGVLYEHPTPEPVTAARGGSVSPELATPTAWLGRRPAHGDGDPDRWRDPARSNELSDQMAALSCQHRPAPTPGDRPSDTGSG